MDVNEFLAIVQRRADLDSREPAEEATAATLTVFAERLDEDATAALAEQLPRELTNKMTGPDIEHGEEFPLDEFVDRVVEREDAGDAASAREHVEAVFAALAFAVSGGLVEDLQARLPGEYATLLDVPDAEEQPE